MKLSGLRRANKLIPVGLDDKRIDNHLRRLKKMKFVRSVTCFIILMMISVSPLSFADSGTKVDASQQPLEIFSSKAIVSLKHYLPIPR